MKATKNTRSELKSVQSQFSYAVLDLGFDQNEFVEIADELEMYDYRSQPQQTEEEEGIWE